MSTEPAPEPLNAREQDLREQVLSQFKVATAVFGDRPIEREQHLSIADEALAEYAASRGLRLIPAVLATPSSVTPDLRPVDIDLFDQRIEANAQRPSLAGWEALARDLRSALASVSPSEPTLDAAWKEAEAALPEGWHLEEVTDESPAPANGVRWAARGRSSYLVVASGSNMETILDSLAPPTTTLTLTEERGGGAVAYESARVEAFGPTPAAALLALAEQLRSAPSRSRD